MNTRSFVTCMRCGKEVLAKVKNRRSFRIGSYVHVEFVIFGGTPRGVDLWKRGGGVDR